MRGPDVYPIRVHSNDIKPLLSRIDVSKSGIEIMKHRFENVTFMVRNISSPGANALKQHILAAGGEAALSRNSITCETEKTDVLVSLRRDRLDDIADKLRRQCWKLPKVAEQMVLVANETHAPWHTSSFPGSEQSEPAVMGILNVTPDSFSDGGAFTSVDAARRHADAMVADGVDIIDIGGESTRPGAAAVSADEEIQRVVPVISAVCKDHPGIPVSIDTTKPSVAAKALHAGASIINDVGGTARDGRMADTAARHNAFLIIMHMRGTPRTMQQNPTYSHVIEDIRDALIVAVNRAVERGVGENRIVVDPGIGFGKTTEHNLTVVKHFDSFRCRNIPLLFGASRKSFLGDILNTDNPMDRETGTTAVNMIAMEHGAAILRVHDVQRAVRARSVFTTVRRAPCS